MGVTPFVWRMVHPSLSLRSETHASCITDPAKLATIVAEKMSS
jgi:hypothetical protein